MSIIQGIFFYEKKKNEDGQDNETAKTDLSSP